MAVDGFDLTGKCALVVGTTSEVNRSIAAALGEAGANVMQTQPSADGHGEQIVEQAAKQLGGLDVVVSSADLRIAGPFTELSDNEWDRLVRVNLTGPVKLLQAAGKQLLARGGGRIIVVASMLGERGLPNTAAYGACQAGLMQLVRALALEWARSGIRINGIGLGWLEGDPLVPDSAALTRFLPTRRLGRPEEVGATAVYLASDAADMMTGQMLWIDGGAISHA